MASALEALAADVRTLADDTSRPRQTLDAALRDVERLTRELAGIADNPEARQALQALDTARAALRKGIQALEQFASSTKSVASGLATSLGDQPGGPGSATVSILLRPAGESAPAAFTAGHSDLSLADVTSLAERINPGFDPNDPSSPFGKNCGSVAANLFDAMNGKALVEAGPSSLDIPQMEARTGLPQERMAPEEIASRLRALGPGSHCVVGIDRVGDRPGHWFNAFFDGSEVYVVDGQVGRVSRWPPHEPSATNWDASFAPRSF